MDATPAKRRRWGLWILLGVPALVLAALAIAFATAFNQAGRVLDRHRHDVEKRVAALKSERVLRPVLFEPAEEGNGWDLLAASLKALSDLGEEELEGFPSFSLDGDPVPNPERIEAVMVKIQPQLESLKRSLSRSWVEPGFTYDNLASQDFSQITQSLRACKIFRDAAIHLHAGGRGGESVELILMALGIADRLIVKGAMLHELVAAVDRSQGFEALQEILEDHSLSSEALHRLARAVKSLARPPAEEGAWMGRHDLYMRLTALGLFDRSLKDTSLDGVVVASPRHFFSLRIMVAEALEAQERYAQSAVSLTRLPMWKRRTAGADLYREFMENPSILQATLMPEFGRAWRSLAEGAQRQRLAQVSLAVARHRAESGAYPDSLSRLVPEWLEEIPTDPLTGGPLGYVVRGDQAIVYFWGGDGDDDGGRSIKAGGVTGEPDEDGDVVWTVKRRP